MILHCILHKKNRIRIIAADIESGKWTQFCKWKQTLTKKQSQKAESCGITHWPICFL